MQFIKSLILLSGLFFILNSCTSLSEASKVLRNDKSGGTDEFLIQKKDPLTQPPDYKTIPEPGSTENIAKSDTDNVEKIIKKNKSGNVKNRTKSSSTEKSILNNIKK